MAVTLETIKQQFGKNRGRTTVLGVLSVVMGILVLRAVLQMSARPAAASVVAEAPGGDAVQATMTAAVSAEADVRLKQSRELWKTMREVRGTPAGLAFQFDPAYYQPDPSRPRPAVAEPAPEPLKVLPPVTDAEAERRARTAAVTEQARKLVVRSTVLNAGSGGVAVINDRVLSVGDHIDGFEIRAIRAREVEFRKDDVNVINKMVDMPRGQ